MKYYYTTVVGVDYMLSQILSSRRYEVYMQMASEDNMWKNSKAAKRAAELKEHYVTLMNKFCHMAGLSTADLPAFSHYRAHKLRKKKRQKARQLRKEANRKGKHVKMGFWEQVRLEREAVNEAVVVVSLSVNLRSNNSLFLISSIPHLPCLFRSSQIFSRPPDRTEGVPDMDRDMTTIAEGDSDNDDGETGVEMQATNGKSNGQLDRDNSAFEQSNPMASKAAKAKSKSDKMKKKEELEKAVASRGEDWQLATDPQTGKEYMYNTKTGEAEWLPKDGKVKATSGGKDKGDKLSEVGKAVGMDNATLLEMLKKPPKDVPEIHSKDAFRKFFKDFPKDRVEKLLIEANSGKSKEDIAKKVKKRMKLLEGVLT